MMDSIIIKLHLILTAGYASKRNAQAQGSKYSYENYYKSSGAYNNYNHNTANYYRPKTSNYSDIYQQHFNTQKYDNIKLSKSAKIFIVIFIIFIYLSIFISTILNMTSMLNNSQNDSNYPKTSNHSKTNAKDNLQEKDKNDEYKYNHYNNDFDINSYIYNTPSNNAEKSFNQALTNEINNKTIDNSIINTVTIDPDKKIDKEKTSPKKFDINTVYTDSELKDAYDSFFYILYPNFEDFKDAMSDYLYETNFSENIN